MCELELDGVDTIVWSAIVSRDVPALEAPVRYMRVVGRCGDRFEARLKLAKLPRNSSKTRIRNRCELTGRPRAYYRKLRMSRIALRDLGSHGQIPGLVKSSW